MEQESQQFISDEKYTEKIDILEQLITEKESGNGVFNVVNFEAGFGKSVETDRIIGEYITEDFVDRKFLIVKSFDNDVLESAEKINKIAKENYEWGEPPQDFAIGIIAENWKKLKKQLETIKDAQVLVITHERYFRLFYDEKMRKVFSEGRHTLIHDECPKEPIFTFSEKEYKEYRDKLPAQFLLDEKFAKICEPIFELINALKKKANNRDSIQLVNKKELKIDIKLVKEFKELLLNKDNALELAENYLNADKILQFINNIEIMNYNQCVYSDGRICTYDKNYWFWTLENNIILDANAYILDKKYNYQKEVFIRYHQSRIMNHEKSKFIFVKVNTSRTKINSYINFYDEICKQIKSIKNSNDKVLIVTQLKEINELKKKLEEYEM